MVAPQVEVAHVGPGHPGWHSYVKLFADYRTHYGRSHELDRCGGWLRDLSDAGRITCYLAMTGTGTGASPAGMALVVPSPASQALGLYWQLRDLFVAPGHRRAGVGLALVSSVSDGARAAGALRLALQTETDNTAALALYHRLGFVDVEGYAAMMLTL